MAHNEGVPRALAQPLTLAPNATQHELVAALNSLLKSSKTHGVELEGIRMAVQAQSTRIELFCAEVELALRAVLKEVNHD